MMESILQALEEEPELKTNLAHKARLDSRTIDRYLSQLLELGLVMRKKSGEYEISRNGSRFLKEYAEIKKYDSI